MLHCHDMIIIKNNCSLMADLERFHNNSLNSSTSKQQYSFKKEARFKQNLKTEGADRYYEIPNSRKNMAFSFGKLTRGQLVRFGKGTQSPPPGSYEIQGSLDKMLKKKEGVKVMYGREQCKSGNIFQRSDNPGPGTYNPNPQVTEPRLSKAFTMGKITMNKTAIKEDQAPGPGAYPIPSLLLNENKILSHETKKTYGKIMFPESKSIRIKTEVAPSMRLPEITFKGEKTIRGDKGFTMSKSARFKLKTITDIPGPGFYNKFSEFIDGLNK